MITQFSRTEMLIGSEGVNKLKKFRVAVFGLGGVGGYVAEALARAGLGALDLIDSDTVSLSNINRQILALHSTVGMLKTEAAKQRLLDINPNLQIVCHNCFYLPETADSFDFYKYDYVADAIETVADISKTSVCPLAKVMRKELRKRGINHFKTVYSEEPALTPLETAEDSNKRQTPGSISYVPAVVGLLMAGEIIRDLLKQN